jgi:hypothetical protein
LRRLLFTTIHIIINTECKQLVSVQIANSIPNSYSNPEEEEWPDFSSEAKQSCSEPKGLDSGLTVSYRPGGLSDEEDDEDCGECDRREIPKQKRQKIAIKPNPIERNEILIDARIKRFVKEEIKRLLPLPKPDLNVTEFKNMRETIITVRSMRAILYWLICVIKRRKKEVEKF